MRGTLGGNRGTALPAAAALRSTALRVTALAALLACVLAPLARAETAKAPKVTKQPLSVTADEGQAVTFTAAASGTPTPTVQWEASSDGGATWHAIEGASSTTLLIGGVKGTENGEQLRAAFRNSAGEAQSKAATLTVQTAPAIERQPASVLVEEGSTATFEATASGNPAPTVKWESSSDGGHTWALVAGATSPTLTIADVTGSLSGREYRAAFKNVVSEALSAPATLSVEKAPAITLQPTSVTADEGQPAAFEASASGFPVPSVQWEASSDGGATWHAIEGATSPALTIADATIAEDGRELRATFSNSVGSVTSAVATLTVHAPPLVTQQPANVTIELGESASFEATASGYPTPTEQWEQSSDGGSSWSAVAGASSPKLTIEDPPTSYSGHEYRAVFTSTAGRAVSATATLTVATNRFSAVAWGDNSYRQLGDGFQQLYSSVPVAVSGLQFVTAVAAGGRHSLALLADGSVVAWGANGLGQLGDGGTSESAVPVAVPGLSEVRAIAAGDSHSLALLANGTVMAWGDDEDGQLGVGGGVEYSSTPLLVKGLANVKAIAAGADYSLALLATGTVRAWGDNESGQLGTGTLAQSSTPVAVKRLSGVTQVAAGGEFSLALLSDGTVQAWGDDESGQLANASIEEGFSKTPVAVEGLSGVTQVAAGTDHALALLSNGTVDAWGDDDLGEVGDGTVAQSRPTPTAVNGLSGVTAISAGDQDSAALLQAGTVMTWGTNASGVLGAGSSLGMSDVPVAVVGLSKVASVSAGRAQMLAFDEPIPLVTAVSPSLGSSAGGTQVTIDGAALQGATAVRFGSAQAQSFTVESSTAITAVAPPGSGTVDVTVTTPSGTSPPTSADRFTYESAPTVTKLSAKSGPASGGTQVTITGSGFSGASAVSFGAVAAQSFKVVSPTTITAVTPAETGGQVNVSVSNVAGQSAPSSKARFKFVPTVEALAPGTGSSAGGTVVLVSGHGFALGTATTFKFGKTKAKLVDCTSATSCEVTAPAHAAGAVDVTASANKATSAANPPGDRFTYE